MLGYTTQMRHDLAYPYLKSGLKLPPYQQVLRDMKRHIILFLTQVGRSLFAVNILASRPLINYNGSISQVLLIGAKGMATTSTTSSIMVNVGSASLQLKLVTRHIYRNSLSHLYL